MSNDAEFTSPVGRMVSGDAYRARDKDSDGKPLIIKNGANAGQPRVEYSVGVAVPKGSETHWNQTPWGLQLWNQGREHHPACFDAQSGAMLRDVAFKVVDGDSQVPNTKNIRNCDREGYPGHWVIFFTNGSAPRYYNADGTTPLTEQVIKRGHWIQVFSYVKGNGSTQNPGLYLNLTMIAHSGYDVEIASGADASQVGFGGGNLPAHVTQQPVGGLTNTPPPPAPGAGTPPPPAHDLVQPGAGTPPPPAPGAGTPPPPAPGAGTPPPPPPPAVTEVSYIYNGGTHTRSQVLSWPGWTEAHLEGLPVA